MTKTDSHTGSIVGIPAGPRAWQRMLSGRRLDLLDPSPKDVDIGDIAHGLARVARWNGQTLGPHAFSVAQHVCLVETITGALSPKCAPSWRLAALLHDAPEYVIGDLISPFKAAVGFNYKAFEQKLLAAIHARFELEFPVPQDLRTLIKHADRVAAYYEATRLAGFSSSEAEQFFGEPPKFNNDVATSLDALWPLPAEQAQALFKDRFEALTAKRSSTML